VRLTNFINVFLFEVDCSKSARNEESSSRGALNSGLTSADSGLQLDLEIALGGASAKVKPPNRLFRTGRKCVETSDDVIEGDSTITPDSRILDFSPTPQPSCETASNLSSTKSGGDVRVHCDNRNRFIATADEKLTAFLELERVTRESFRFQNAE
jgi:hypothetical protein